MVTKRLKCIFFVIKNMLSYAGRLQNRKYSFKVIYINRFPLQMLASHRNQSLDLSSKQIDWFLYHGSIVVK